MSCLQRSQNSTIHLGFVKPQRASLPGDYRRDLSPSSIQTNTWKLNPAQLSASENKCVGGYIISFNNSTMTAFCQLLEKQALRSPSCQHSLNRWWRRGLSNISSVQFSPQWHCWSGIRNMLACRSTQQVHANICFCLIVITLMKRVILHDCKNHFMSVQITYNIRVSPQLFCENITFSVHFKVAVCILIWQFLTEKLALIVNIPITLSGEAQKTSLN